MIQIERTLSQEEIDEAKRFQDFRNRCKDYLSEHNVCYDKFTITEFDAYIAYITEKYIANYLRDKYRGKICVSEWSDQFDLDHINSIISNNSNEQQDIDLVKDFFYDKFDLYISTPREQFFFNLKIDVKTAITEKTPTANWEFLYPVVQAQKPGKDYVILVYYIADNHNDPSTMRELCIIGYINENTISQCKILRQGKQTRHYTLSQIDNYITHVSDYREIDELFIDLNAD